MSILESSPITAATQRGKALAAAVFVVATVALLAGCGGGGDTTASAPPASQSHSGSSIAIGDFKFSPATLTVRRGARIDVTNSDSASHTVTADDGKSFDSGMVPQGGSATFTATRTGRFPYHCTFHPFMKGVLVVK